MKSFGDVLNGLFGSSSWWTGLIYAMKGLLWHEWTWNERPFQAIEEEGGDPDNIEIPLSVDTPTRKNAKSKGKEVKLVNEIF